MMDFLYFPENKLEYIPAVISFVVFFIGAIVTFRIFQKASKKQLERTEQLYGKKQEEANKNLEKALFHNDVK